MASTVNYRLLLEKDYTQLLSLYKQCFSNNKWFLDYFKKYTDCRNIMGFLIEREFGEGIKYCLNSGLCYGAFNKAGKLIGFILGVYFSKMSAEDRQVVFGLDENGNPPNEECIDKPLDALNTDVLYIVTLGVSPEYRRQGIAKTLLTMLVSGTNYSVIAADVTEEYTLPMYNSLNFSASKISEGYYFVVLNRNLANGF